MGAAYTDLTTLTNLKSYLTNPGNLADATLQRLLSAASVAIENYLSRDIVVQTYNKTFDGNHNSVMSLPEYPIINVSSVTIHGQTIPVGGVTTAGFWFTDKQLMLTGYKFWTGHNGVVVNYTAGFQITGEAATIPAGTPWQYTALQPKGTWLSDQGVSYAGGAALTAVSSNPSVGQYSVAAGVYTFAAADEGKAVVINYGYSPLDLEQATIGLVQYWLADRTRPGEASRAMAGQTISYSQKDMPEWVKTSISKYQRTFMQ